jgi:cbb3-type cytochrome oxidase maturation protein
MNMLALLIPVALGLGALGLGAFLWSLSNGQYEDLDGAALRILQDDRDETQHAAVRDRPAKFTAP